MDHLKTIQSKWTKKYIVKKLFYKDLLLLKVKVFLKKQKYLDYSKIKKIMEINFNKKFPICYVLVCNKKIVGFVGVLFAEKYSFNKKYINCNIHSLVVYKSHRLVSHLLFRDILKKKYTITVLSSLARLKTYFEKIGFKTVTMKYKLLFTFNFLKLFKKEDIKILVEKRKILQKLKKKDLKIYNDHSSKKYEKFIIYNERKNSEYSLVIGNIITKKKFLKIFNLLYCSNKNFLKENSNYFYSNIYNKFNINMCGQYYLNETDCVLNNRFFNFSFNKKKLIFIKNQPKKFEFNGLYSELEY